MKRTLQPRFFTFLILALLCPRLEAAAAAAASEVTYTADVAPILMKRCVSCHRPGEPAPMSLVTYDETRPWSKSIREAVTSRKMPPWQADPKHGSFSNDISLSQREVDTIVQWVDGGSRRGDPKKMPAAPKFPDGWKLGEPDYVLDLGEIQVPESGPDLFLDRHVQLQLPEDRWVRAVEVRPGNRKVLHHLVTFAGYIEMSGTGQPGSPRQARPMTESPRILSVWAAGTPPTVFPDGIGHAVRKDQDLTFNIHIHPNGTRTTDQSKIGIYFGKGNLEKSISTGLVANPGILLPAGASNVESTASYVFSQDSRIVSLFPHMHLRGKQMSFEVTYPDGRRQVLLDVPRYDFNWQWLYYPDKPIDVPAGSRLDILAHWDNSAANPHNPDPTKTVEFGEGTDWEMHVGFFDYIVTGTEKPKTARERVDVLLQAHPAQTGYVLDIGAGATPSNWGLHLTKDGKATLYVVERGQILTVTLRDVVWNGSEVTMQGKAIRGAGATIPIGIRASVSDTGEISGKIFIGARVSPGPEPQGLSVVFKGKRRDTQAIAAAR